VKTEHSSPSGRIITVHVPPSSKAPQTCLPQVVRRVPDRASVQGRQDWCCRKHLNTPKLFTLFRWGNVCGGFCWLQVLGCYILFLLIE